MNRSVRDRVFSAAEIISFECIPTVPMVRAATGIGELEASLYLAEWTAEHRLRSGQSPYGAGPADSPSLLGESGEADAAKYIGEIPGDRDAEALQRIERLESEIKLLEDRVRDLETREKTL
ncbi:hypothetical protein [Paenarthrobacter sp. NPDC057981]|uniref:hypothetical protein n=1 Tax=Paenarthrobacter sp. NPDC057981 TaxID=3346297 RepID=UPI0036D9F7AA